MKDTGKNAGSARKHFTEQEIAKLRRATRRLQNPLKWDTYILLAYRHGLRVSEAVALLWDDLDWSEGTLEIRRLKNGIDSTHPLNSEELSLLRKLYKTRNSPYIIYSRIKGRPLHIQSVREILKKLEVLTGVPNVHSHRLRHSCGYHMARKGIPALKIQQWMGHQSISNTLIYVRDAASELKAYRDW
jgi:type 1 fimbriae regulatory protein FimB/type 1 fimbriae regulatory protein FimE